MASCGKADYKNKIRIDVQFFCVVADVFHCCGCVDKWAWPNGISRSVYGITKNKGIKSRCKICVRNGICFSVGAKGICSAWNNKHGFSFFIESKLSGGAGNISSKCYAGFSFYQVDCGDRGSCKHGKFLFNR